MTSRNFPAERSYIERDITVKCWCSPEICTETAPIEHLVRRCVEHGPGCGRGVRWFCCWTRSGGGCKQRVLSYEKYVPRLDIVSTWMKDHRLELAPDKTEVLVMKRPKKRDHVPFSLDRAMLKAVKTVKYLGVTLDEKGSFGPHVKNAVSKVKQRRPV